MSPIVDNGIFPGRDKLTTSLSDKEAKILARLNARKNRSAALQTDHSALPDASQVSKPEVDTQLKKSAEVVLLDTQVVTENKSTVKKLKRKNQTEHDETTVVDKAAVAVEEPAVKRPKREKKKVYKTVANDGQQEAKTVKPKKKKKKGPKVPKKEPVLEENVTETTEDVNQPDTELVEPTGEGFTVMEEVKVDKNLKTFRILPNWLAKPSVISCDLTNNKLPIKEVKGLDKFLLDKLMINKIHHLFPVQQQIIPWLLESQQQLYRPSDICVSAPTGSGKTLAFVLPTVQALLKQTVRRLRCLVVLPVHDLAVQVHRVYTSFCVGTKLNVALISGQSSFHDEQQQLVRKGKSGEYLSKADIAVCTPGRLVDHIQSTAGFSLKSLCYLIIDEADRIMDETHNDWLYHVEKAINASMEPLVAQKLSRPWENYVQKLLFSATLSQDPEKLTRLGLFQPKLFTSVVSSSSELMDTSSDAHHFIGKYTTPAELTEHFVESSAMFKPLVVYHLLKKFNYRPALCFSASRDATHRLCLLLSNLDESLKVAECSSEISKTARDKLLKDFSSGKIDLMVCTDAVARGMDLGVVDCVISYEPPKFVKNYIHRVGRTARAGKPGTAITILTDSEIFQFNKMIESAEKKNVTPLVVETEELQTYEEKFRGALDSLKTSMTDEKKVKTLKSKRARRQNQSSRDPRAIKAKMGKVVSAPIFRARPKMIKLVKQPSKK